MSIEDLDKISSVDAQPDTFELFKPIIIESSTENKRFSETQRLKSDRRILDRNGKQNIFLRDIPHKHSRYAKDMGNTLINIRWRWILLSLCVANGIAWVLFAFMWMAIAMWNEDLNKSEADSCVVGTRNFAGYLLLSIETLTTIGFGVIYPGDCLEAWIVLTLQAMTGVAIEGALVTAVYVKMSRPFRKHSSGIFSKRATISLRDDKFCLIFRVFDENGKHLTMTQIKAFFIRKIFTEEGEELDNFMVKLKLEKWGLIIWPVDVVHVIDDTSPLWDYSAKDLLTSRFEIIVVIQGDSTTTGQPSQSQTSYTGNTILWGYRFSKCIEFDDIAGKYFVLSDKFNATTQYDTPLCSASRYYEVMEEVRLGVHLR